MTDSSDLARSAQTDSTRNHALSVVLVVPNAKRRQALAEAVARSRCNIVGEFEDYPTGHRLDELVSLACDVVVVDLDDNLGRAIGSIEEICSRQASITVMASSAGNDPALLRRSMQAGAREFLMEPLLSETVGEALGRALARRPRLRKADGKMLVFVPSKGGVGVTTLAANFSVALKRESGARVVVVDMDFQMGEIALGLSMTATFSVLDALQNIDRMDGDFLSGLLIRHRSGLAVLAAPESFTCFQLSTIEPARRMFRLLRAEFDYVVVDGSMCQGQLQEALLEMADKLYLVTELTLPALRNAHRLISYLADNYPSDADGGSRLEVVVNRFNSRQGDIDENSAVRALGRPVKWRIPNGYAAVRAAQDDGVPLAQESSPITKALVRMARVACGKPVSAEKKAGAGFRFFGAKHVAEPAEI